MQALHSLLKQVFQDASVTQPTEYARKCLDRVLNISWVLNMPGFWIWKVLNMQELHRVLNKPQYDRIRLNRTWICLNMSEFSIIDRVLNMYHAIHSARSLQNLTSTYGEITYPELGQRSNIERFGKITIVFN